MKKRVRYFIYIAPVALALTLMGCKKDKNDPKPDSEPEVPNETEMITTLQLHLTDSITGAVATYQFRDPDGPGGQPAYYGPTAATQSDSVFSLAPNATYYCRVIILDETKTPADSTSNDVLAEGQDHMLFYNNGGNTIVNSGNPYAVQLNGSLVSIRYVDMDGGTPQRPIGLRTRWRTAAATGSAKWPLNITLRHQPGVKDGTYAPGETDVSVDFKYRVN